MFKFVKTLLAQREARRQHVRGLEGYSYAAALLLSQGRFVAVLLEHRTAFSKDSFDIGVALAVKDYIALGGNASSEALPLNFTSH